MAQPFADKPLIIATGSLLFVEVRTDEAAALCAYLRRNFVVTSPPSPSSTGFDSIELGKGTDLDRLQAALDSWAVECGKAA